MNKYELMYIVGTQYTDAEVGEIQTKIAGMLEKVGAKIVRNEMVGKIRLAYIIKKMRHGSYVLVHFDAPGEVVNDLNRQFNLTEEILRHTILTREPGAETKAVEIFAYVAPLSDEAKRAETKAQSTREKEGKAEESAVETKEVKETVVETAVVDAKDANLSVEELDKKLDAILEDDLSEKV